ncbi:hypothetical protein ACFWVT_08070 [Streptomyces cyaneofuscatus]|uniref:hypothetical protein n=1 Tax=Streptomyces cyaneofuscatus TaxID=66883 RepID=UPI0036688113
MCFFKREGRRRSGFVPVVMAVVCSAAVALGAQNMVSRVGERESPQEVKNVSPAGMGVREGEFVLYEPVWTTAHIIQKGLHLRDFDTGLVVSYVGPPDRNPGKQGDWVGIYERGQLDKAHRKDWDWVCPNEHDRCKSFGSAVIPAGNDGLESGKTYTVAYWTDRSDESSGKPAVTIEYHVPW